LSLAIDALVNGRYWLLNISVQGYTGNPLSMEDEIWLLASDRIGCVLCGGPVVIMASICPVVIEF
jgi:hypothetical protein